MRKIKRKILISSVFSIFLMASVVVAFSAYVITNDIKEEVTINPTDIEVKEENQTFLSYKSVSRKIYTYDGDIVSDVFSISFDFNQNEYLTTSNSLGISTNSGIGARIKFSSNELYKHVRDNVGNSFINISHNNYLIGMEKNKVYMSDGQYCLYFENSSSTCFFHIPMSSDKANQGSNFYVQKIAEDNNLTNGTIYSGGVVKDNIWQFDINFNFYIIDDSVGYSTTFNKTSFSNVDITLLFEDYR